MSPVIAWICCDKAFLSPHTFSTDEVLLTHKKNARDVILRHVQPPLKNTTLQEYIAGSPSSARNIFTHDL